MLRVAEGLDLVVLDGDAVGFLPATGRVVRLNPTARGIVDGLRAGFDWAEIVATLGELGVAIDPLAVRSELVTSGVLVAGTAADDTAGPDEQPGTASPCATELRRPHCADPVGADPDAVGFVLRTPNGTVTFRTDDHDLADHVREAFASTQLTDPADPEAGWAVTAHVEPAGRGVHRLHELRASGAVVGRTRSRAELAEWSTQALAMRLLTISPDCIPLVGGVQRAGNTASATTWCWVGVSADDLRIRGLVPRHEARPLPAVVLTSTGARTPAAVAGIATSEPDPRNLVLVVPDSDRPSQLARILAAVPPDLVRNATTDQLVARVAALPWSLAGS